MMMQIGQRWRCQNSKCGAEIEVTRDSIEGKSSVKCRCGAVMKKPYSNPVLTAIAGNDSFIAERSRQTAQVYRDAGRQVKGAERIPC
jgi:hypothetical protein